MIPISFNHESLLSGSGAANPPNSKEASVKAAKDFESFFAYYLLKVMRESVPKGGLLNSGMGENVYNSLIDENIAEGISSRGGLGLSDLIIKQMELKQNNNNK